MERMFQSSYFIIPLLEDTYNLFNTKFDQMFMRRNRKIVSGLLLNYFLKFQECLRGIIKVLAKKHFTLLYLCLNEMEERILLLYG